MVERAIAQGTPLEHLCVDPSTPSKVLVVQSEYFFCALSQCHGLRFGVMVGLKPGLVVPIVRVPQALFEQFQNLFAKCLASPMSLVKIC